MQIKTKLMQKNGIAAIKIARELITMKVGDRIKTIADYSEQFEAARGTVQSAINLLKETKALELQPRGHMGTFISFIDYEIMWKFTDYGTLMGVMPLPYSKRYEGLATGLYKTVETRSFPFSLAFMRGAETRISALKDGRYDFAVVSKLAALEGIKRGIDIDIVVGFGEKSYVNEHVLIFSEEKNEIIKDGMKVGIDRNSIDHAVLTKEVCKDKEVELVDLKYNQVITKLQSKEIDAAIWNLDEVKEKKLNLKYKSISEILEKNTDSEAVVIVDNSKFGIKNLLKKIIDKDTVIETQEAVIEEKIIPSY